MRKSLKKVISVSLSMAMLVSSMGFSFQRTETVVEAATASQKVKEHDAFAKEVAELIEDSDTKSGDYYLNSSNEFVTKRLVIKAKDSSFNIEKYNPEDFVENSENIYVAQFNTITAAKNAFKEISKLSNIEYVEPDEYVECQALDTNTVGIDSYSWGVSAMGADTFGSFTSSITNREVTVAVIDSGVANHSYLNGKMKEGYDFVSNDNNPTDENGHGTYCAGIVVDCAPGVNVKIMPVRVLGTDGKGSKANIATGIRYAADHGADVMNLSLGSYGTNSTVLTDALKYAISKGSVPVLSAGNNGKDTANRDMSYMSEPIVVGAINSSYTRASFSNYGASVDVVAAGVNVTSISWQGGTTTANGTSAAAPHIAGVAAMLKALYPSKNASQIEKIITSNTRDLGPSGRDDEYGYGIPNLSQLVGDVHLYNDADYGQYMAALGEGTYTLSQLQAKGFDNDTLSSLKVPAGYTVTLYDDNNFSGKSMVVTGDTSYVGDSMNDCVSSIKVEAQPTVKIYKDSNYSGSAQALLEGTYTLSQLQAKGYVNDTLSSLKVPFGYKVTLYNHDNFGGSSMVVTGDTSYVGSSMNDCVSSIKVEKAIYTIVNRYSGKVLDISNSNKNNGANVQQWTSNGTNAQKWYIKQNSDYSYTITSVLSGKVLDVADWSTNNGANVQVWDGTPGQANQQWWITNLGNGYSSIINKHSNKALDVADWSTSIGGNIQQWDYSQQANQQWSFKLVN